MMNTKTCLNEWRCRSMMLLAIGLPLLIALLLSWYLSQQQPEPFTPIPLEPVTVDSADELERTFARHAYQWPAQQVPALAVRSLPHDMQQLQVARKKRLFFQMLLPLVVAENARLRLERDWLEAAADDDDIDTERLSALAEEYRLDPAMAQDKLMSQLLLRVDTVPAGLVLAQAANESGWGTSRFSREVNNLFGEWTWNADKGVVPTQRAEGAEHFVRRFASLRESLRSYLHNINSGEAYKKLRSIRASLRSQDKPLDPLLLATGLERYSARGQAYVAEIQAMIRTNGLNILGRPDLVR